MPTLHREIESLQTAFAQATIETSFVNDTPVLKLNRDDVPVVAHYIHTHPGLRGTLSLLWAVDHRHDEARYEIFYLFTLTDPRNWLLVTTDLRDDDRLFHSIASRLRKKAIKKVVARVVPSKATHWTPRLLAMVAATMARRNI